MTGNKNRAFENDEGEMTDQQRSANGDNHDGSNVSSFSRKIFPHGVHGPDLSKFVRDLNILKIYVKIGVFRLTSFTCLILMNLQHEKQSLKVKFMNFIEFFLTFISHF